MTALYLAVTEDCPSTIKCYSKVDRTTANSDNGWSTLHLAVRCGYASTAKLLLEYNAPLEPLGRAGAMPIHTAVWEAQYDMLQLLLDFGGAVVVENSDGCSALILAGRLGDLTAVEILLGGGANVDKQSPTGRTACNETIRSRATDVAENLVEMGADTIDVSGRSCFDWVAVLIYMTPELSHQRNALLSQNQL